jgi:hypothetical protein
MCTVVQLSLAIPIENEGNCVSGLPLLTKDEKSLHDLDIELGEP